MYLGAKFQVLDWSLPQTQQLLSDYTDRETQEGDLPTKKLSMFDGISPNSYTKPKACIYR